jgi:hypothetical protein
MPTAAPQSAQDRWCDVDGTHLALSTGLRGHRKHQTRGITLPTTPAGQILGRGLDSIYVCFEDNVLISLPSHLVRLLPDAPSKG